MKISTDTQIKKAIRDATTQNKEVTLTVTGSIGLQLRIRPKKDGSSTADFRHRLPTSNTRKPKFMQLGQYPTISLAEAKQAHRDNLVLLAKDIDPIDNKEKELSKQRQAIANTFEAVADRWLKSQINNIHNAPSAKTQSNWNNQLEPLIKEFGKRPIDSITTSQIVNLCERIQKTHVEKGSRVHGLANRIFAYAVLHNLIEYNPVSQIKGARILRTHKTSSHPALTKPHEFACLLKDIDQMSESFNKSILQLLSLTFVRVGDVCSMRWCDIDFNNKQWTLKPQKAKGKSDMVEELIIPLAPQVIAILEAIKPLTEAYDYVFYNHRRKIASYHHQQAINATLNNPTMNKQGVGDNYENKGYKSVHSPHGFRASAKTLLMERLGYDELLTEMQLGHKMLNKYGTAYNRMKAIEERTKMMTEWANYLDDLRMGKVGNVIRHDFKKDQKSIKTS